MGVPSVDITGSTSGGSDRKGHRQSWRPPTRPKTQKQATKPARASAGGGGGGGRGGGGGGGAADKRKAFINYYRRYLNIKPNMALVEKAVKGDYTMAEFQLLVQREDTAKALADAHHLQNGGSFRGHGRPSAPSAPRGLLPAAPASTAFRRRSPLLAGRS